MQVSSRLNKKEIKFYSKNKEYREFSNMFIAPFEIEGVVYPSVEHYYQSAKWEDANMKKFITSARSAALAKEFSYLKPGRWTSDENKKLINKAKEYTKKNNLSFNKNFDKIKYDVMVNGVREKFKQNENLMTLLLSTGDAVLMENSPDSYWGIGKDGTGRNNLGNILMNLRDSMLNLLEDSKTITRKSLE